MNNKKMKIRLAGKWLRPQQKEVSSLREASTVFRSFIERYNFGVSDLGKGAGEVFCKGKIVAQISYNGRAWQPGQWPQPEILL